MKCVHCQEFSDKKCALLLTQLLCNRIQRDGDKSVTTATIVEIAGKLTGDILTNQSIPAGGSSRVFIIYLACQIPQFPGE
jgi:hypothetical protein